MNNQPKEMEFKDLFLYDISHPNQQGCKLIAENLYQVIIDMVKRDE